MSIKYANINGCPRSFLLVAVLLGIIAIPGLALADDKTDGKNTSNPPAEDTAKKIDAPAAGLTEREMAARRSGRTKEARRGTGV